MCFVVCTHRSSKSYSLSLFSILLLLDTSCGGTTAATNCLCATQNLWHWRSWPCVCSHCQLLRVLLWFLVKSCLYYSCHFCCHTGELLQFLLKSCTRYSYNVILQCRNSHMFLLVLSCCLKVLVHRMFVL